MVLFTEWLAKNGGDLSGRAVDIGAGKSRNSIHLAKMGFEVWALEYIEPAIRSARKLAEFNKVSDKIHFKLAEVDTAWQIQDDYFNLAVDLFCSVDIETKEGREKCRDEMYRTLKPGGHVLVMACSSNDEWEKELIAKHPGPEPNSSLWPKNGKFQKNYDETELLAFYKDFEVVELKTIRKPALKLGRSGTSTDFWMVLRKK